MKSILRSLGKTFPLLAPVLLVSCIRVPEMSREQIEAARKKSNEEFFTATISKPYHGEEFAPDKARQFQQVQPPCFVATY